MNNVNPERATAEVELGDLIITVNELTVREIKTFWRELMTIQPSMGLMLTPELAALWDVAIQGISIEDIEDMTPTQLKKVYDKFLEVNDTFFDLARKFEGDNPVLAELRQSVLADLYRSFLVAQQSMQESLDSQSEGTQESGITDTASSLQPSSTPTNETVSSSTS